MKITVIGWYGTETVGDRAILAGLISFFYKAFNDFELNIGSLYPFFTDRTISEDYALWKKIVAKDFKISLFNSKKIKELNEAITSSDFVIMGGGPLMHLEELSMIEYAFKKAKKLKKKTALLGCGVGPIFHHKRFRKYLLNIYKYSDLTILRDKQSKINLIEIANEFKVSINKDSIYVSYDPAVECAISYTKIHKAQEENYVAFNLRSFPTEYAQRDISKSVNNFLEKLVGQLANENKDKLIRLMPMHYFYIGGDDREFLNQIRFKYSQINNIEVQNKNLSLAKTMEVYRNSKFSIGMRFHAVLLQTIVSRKNYILDYTEPKKGKIYGFIKDIDKEGFYNDRYIQLQNEKLLSYKVDFRQDKQFSIDFNKIEELNRKVYIFKIKELFEL